jgi:large subunit ribosomal protein L3
MINGLLGKKLGMTQVYDDGGRLTTVTVIQAGPCRISEIRTKEQHGYDAVQLAYDEVPARKLNKPELGHLKKSNISPSRRLREFDKIGDVQLGQVLRADVFQKGEWVDVEGISKGKGFQGVMKRHNYHGGPETHGSMFHRAPGSIGASSHPSRVWKNKALPGHMGSEKVTVQRLKVIDARAEENLLFISGSVPGATGGFVTVKKSKKS